MPRSGYYTQQCACGTTRRAAASLTIAASSLGVVPRRKSRAVTVYICDECLNDPKPKLRRRLIESLLSAAIEARDGK